MSGHTPGPWQAKNDVMDWDEIIGNIDGPSDGEYTCAHIATIHYIAGGEIGEAQANARLIAAAPELLAVAEAGQRLMSIPIFDEAFNPAWDEFRRLSVAAIAKATP